MHTFPVDYHGSITDAHGRYTARHETKCPRDLDHEIPYWMGIDERLILSDPETGRVVLTCVRTSSVTKIAPDGQPLHIPAVDGDMVRIGTGRGNWSSSRSRNPRTGTAATGPRGSASTAGRAAAGTSPARSWTWVGAGSVGRSTARRKSGACGCWSWTVRTGSRIWGICGTGRTHGTTSARRTRWSGSPSRSRAWTPQPDDRPPPQGSRPGAKRLTRRLAVAPAGRCDGRPPATTAAADYATPGHPGAPQCPGAPLIHWRSSRVSPHHRS